MNELKIISLNNCPYSMAAEQLIDSIKKIDNININLINVSDENKNNYKNITISTFPQIYFNDKLIGGYDNINEINLEIKRLKSSNVSNKLDKMIKFLNKKLKNGVFKRKEYLLLIKFFIG